MESHLRQHRFDLVERFAPEIRRAQHFGFGLLNEIADIDDVVVLQTIGRADRKLELVDFFQQYRVEREVRLGFVGDAFLGLFEIDEDLELILQNARSISDGVVGADRSTVMVSLS